MDRHSFHPSRPGGTVCVTTRHSPVTTAPEVCGYPATHPVHRVDGPAADVTVPAEGSRERTMGRRFLLRGRPQRVAVIATERGLVAAAAEIEAILDEVLRIPTPAEAATGTSDRAAAALTDVAELRAMIRLHMNRAGVLQTGATERLDRIEAALRETRR